MSGTVALGEGPASPPRPRLRFSLPPRSAFTLAIGPSALLVLWSAASLAGWLDPRVLPAPWSVARSALALIEDGRLTTHLLTSLRRAGLGITLGTLIGGALALLSGLTRSGEALIQGPLEIKRSIPTVALIPLLILWFGIGELMKVLTIAVAALVQVQLHTSVALRTIDARYVELAETLRLSRLEFVRRVALPGALPGFLMGLRLGVTAGWLIVVVVEQINATSGVGYMMSLARSYGQTEIVLVGIVVYGLLGLGSDAAIRVLERRALRWRRSLAA